MTVRDAHQAYMAKTSETLSESVPNIAFRKEKNNRNGVSERRSMERMNDFSELERLVQSKWERNDWNV